MLSTTRGNMVGSPGMVSVGGVRRVGRLIVMGRVRIGSGVTVKVTTSTAGRSLGRAELVCNRELRIVRENHVVSMMEVAVALYWRV